MGEVIIIITAQRAARVFELWETKIEAVCSEVVHMPAITWTAEQNVITIRNMSQSLGLVPENWIWQRPHSIHTVSLTSTLLRFSYLTSETTVAEGNVSGIFSFSLLSRGCLSSLFFVPECSWMKQRFFVCTGCALLCKMVFVVK